MAGTKKAKGASGKKSPPRAKKDEGEIIAYKAFNRDLTCSGYQFEIGKTFEQPGKIVVCSNGFHSCENPFDVLNYYDLCDSRFCVVRASGEIARHEGDSKLASAKLTVEAELKLPDFIGKCVNYLLSIAKGDDVQAASGDSSQLAASGNSSKLAASGNSSQLAASGDYSKLAASGDSSQLAASGNYSKLEIAGSKSAAAAVGPDSMVKAVAGTPIAICEYDRNGNPVGFATGIAGKDCPVDTWLIAKNGKLVEAAQ